MNCKGNSLKKHLLPVINVFRCITGTALEEFVVRLDIGGQVHNFACCQWPCRIEHNGVAVMIRPLEMAGEADLANVLAALRRVCGGNFILREDGSIGTLRYAGT